MLPTDSRLALDPALAVTPARPRLRTIVTGLIIATCALCGFGVAHMLYRSLTATQQDFMDDVTDDTYFIREPRTGFCYEVAFSRDGLHAALAPCESVAADLDRKLDWMTEHIWYFHDIQPGVSGVCYAVLTTRHERGETVVPCAPVERFLTRQSADGRYAYEDWNR